MNLVWIPISQTQLLVLKIQQGLGCRRPGCSWPGRDAKKSGDDGGRGNSQALVETHCFSPKSLWLLKITLCCLKGLSN